MPRTNSSQETSDRIPANLSKAVFGEIENYSKHEDFRKKVQEIVEECTNQVTFMDKVKGYASRELDERLFKNGFTILIWIISVLGSAVVGGIITKYIFK